jgi:hydrogenase expression/formation protein HypD
MGALMVSSEGACAAYYQYGDLDALEERRRASA